MKYSSPKYGDLKIKKKIEANVDELEVSVQDQVQVCKSLQQIPRTVLKPPIADRSVMY